MLKELIAKGNIKEVISRLKDNNLNETDYNTLIILENNYINLERDNRGGLIRTEENRISYNTICNGLLELIDSYIEDEKINYQKKLVEIVIKVSPKYEQYNKSHLVKKIIDGIIEILDDENIDLEGFRIGSIIATLKISEKNRIKLLSFFHKFKGIDLEFGKILEIRNPKVIREKLKIRKILLLIPLSFLFLFFLWTKYYKAEQEANSIEKENVALLRKAEELRDEIYNKRLYVDSLRKIIAIQDFDLSKSYVQLDSILNVLDRNLSQTQKDIRLKGGTLAAVRINKDNIGEISEILNQVRKEDQSLSQNAIKKIIYQKDALAIKYEEQFQSLEKENAELLSLLKLKDDRIKELENTNEGLADALKSAINNNNFTQAVIDSLLNTNNSNLVTLEDSIKSLNSNIVVVQQEKNNIRNQIQELESAIEKISKNSFKVTYKYKESKTRKEKVVVLDSNRRHKARHIKTINVSFALSDKSVDSPEATVKLELLKSTGELVSPSYSMSVNINDYIGTANIQISKKLKKGIYFLKISYKNVEIQKYKFKVS